MSPSISLEQLATRSKITRKTQKYDYESYQAEYVDLYCRKQNHQSLPASNSTALMGGDTNDEFLKDLERLEQLDNDITAKKADMTLYVNSSVMEQKPEV